MKLTSLKKILTIMSLAATIAVSSGSFAYATTPAQTPTNPCPTTGSKSQALQGIEEDGTSDCSTSSVQNIASSIVAILSLVVGISSVIAIIAAGFKYITSGGDSNRVGSAKSTLAYAVVGLVVAALAQFLVHFVLGNIKT